MRYAWLFCLLTLSVVTPGCDSEPFFIYQQARRGIASLSAGTGSNTSSTGNVGVSSSNGLTNGKTSGDQASSPSPGGSGGVAQVSFKADASFKADPSFAAGTQVSVDQTQLAQNFPNLSSPASRYQVESFWRRIQTGPTVKLAPLDYAIAIRGLQLVTATGSLVPFFNASSYAVSKVLSFTPSATESSVGSASLPIGTYTGVVMEVYWVQAKIPIDGTNQRVRVYLSDDDFNSETVCGGCAGRHHQGDVTFIDDSGTELGWVHPPGYQSLPNSFTPLTPRPTPVGGKFFASSPDTATGHDRGPFGNDLLWGVIPAQTPYYVAQQSATPLVLTSGVNSSNIFLNFHDAWAFSDEDGDGAFNPAKGKDASSVGATWNPILPMIRFQ